MDSSSVSAGSTVSSDLSLSNGRTAHLFCAGIGVFQTYYESHQLSNMSTSTVTWITSLETFVMFFAVRAIPTTQPAIQGDRETNSY